MIVRILGDRRYEVPEEYLKTIEALDERLEQALTSEDSDAFQEALELLIKEIKAVGKEIPEEQLQSSDLVVPPSGSTISEVKALLESEN